MLSDAHATDEGFGRGGRIAGVLSGPLCISVLIGAPDNAASEGVSVMLLGGIAFMMSLFYLVKG
eukprot:gene46836-3336_t